MEKKKAKNLFIAEFEKSRIWTTGKRAFLTSIHDGDFYLVFKTGKSDMDIGSMMGKILNDLTEKGSGKIFDAQPLSDEDYIAFIKQQAESYGTEETSIYFLSMDEIYDQMCNMFPWAENVLNSKNYNVGRKRQAKKKLKMSNITGNRESVKNDSNNSGFDVVDSILDNFTSMNIDPGVSQGFQKYGSANTEDKKEKDVRQKKESTDSIPLKEQKNKGQKDKSGTGLEDRKPFGTNIEENDEIQATLRENMKKAEKKDKMEEHSADKKSKASDEPTAPKQPSKPQQKKKNADVQSPTDRFAGYSGMHGQKGSAGGASMGKGGRFGRGAPSAPPPEDGMTLEELERQIFGATYEPIKYEKTYTEMDDGKANMVGMILDRLIGSIQRLVGRTVDEGFEEKDFIELITTLIRSTGYEDFIHSYQCVNAGSNLGIDEMMYGQLKDEAQYYERVCEMLYQDDKWDQF